MIRNLSIVLASALLVGCSTSHSFEADKAGSVDRSDRNVQRMRQGEVDQTGFLPNASGVIGGKTGLTYAEAGSQQIVTLDKDGLWSKTGTDMKFAKLRIELDPAKAQDGESLFDGAKSIEIEGFETMSSPVNPTLAIYIEKAAATIQKLSDDERAKYIQQLQTMGELGQSLIQAIEAVATGGASAVIPGQ